MTKYLNLSHFLLLAVMFIAGCLDNSDETFSLSPQSNTSYFSQFTRYRGNALPLDSLPGSRHFVTLYLFKDFGFELKIDGNDFDGTWSLQQGALILPGHAEGSGVTEDGVDCIKIVFNLTNDPNLKNKIEILCPVEN